MQHRIQRHRALPDRLWQSIVLGFFGALVCLSFQRVSELLIYSTASLADFTQTGVTTFTADITRLSDGTYYASIGRPRGFCDLKIEGRTLSSTKGTVPGIRGGLLLGAGFEIGKANHPKQLTVECENEPGLGFGLTHEPVVCSFRLGVLIQLWRAFTELIMGPVASIALVLLVLFSVSRHHLNREMSSYLCFGIVSFVYSLSLAHYPRLFFGSVSASIAHTFLKTMHQFAFYILSSHYCRVRRSVVFLYLLALSSLTAASAFSPTSLTSVYYYCFFLYCLSAAVAFIDISLRPIRAEASTFMRYVAFAWFLLQVHDTVVDMLRWGAYAGPAGLALISFSLVGLRMMEDQKQMRIKALIRNLLRTINDEKPIEAKVTQMANLIQAETHFSRLSVYVDAFIVGAREGLGEGYLRISEAGYRKNTSQDHLIDPKEGRGLEMRKALDTGAINFARGTVDRAWYLNLPVGKFVCINLSDDVERADFLASESFRICNEIFPAARSLYEQLLHRALRTSFELERVRTLKGIGIHESELGTIILDINSYAEHRSRMKDPYGIFVSTVYFPALLKRIRPWAIREVAKGDEICLVTLPEIIQNHCSVLEATCHATIEIMRFQRGEGAQLCQLQGYEPISLQIGVSFGNGKILCNSGSIHLEANAFIEAARLQKAAPPGGVFVSTELAKHWPTATDVRVLPSKYDVAKKTHLSANQLVWLANTDRAA